MIFFATDDFKFHELDHWSHIELKTHHKHKKNHNVIIVGGHWHHHGWVN